MMHKSPRRPLSLQWRVTLLVGLVISIGLAALMWTVQQAIRAHFAIQDAHELGLVIESVEQIIGHPPHAPEHMPLTTQAPQPTVSSAPDHYSANAAQPHWMALQHAASGHQGIYFQLRKETGQTPVIIYQTPGPDLSAQFQQLPLQTPSAMPQLSLWQYEDKELRGALIQLPDYQLLLASDMTFHLHFLDEFHTRLLLITLSIGILTLLAAWFGIQRGHAPLRQLRQRIGEIGSEQLHQRLNPDASPTELLGLIEAFNQMLGRIEEGFERLSNFSADIAHELRTPLAALITQTQVALSQARSLEEYRELLYSSLEEEERLSRMVADMLWLAKTDNGLLILRARPLDLNSEVEDLHEFFEAWADEQAVRLTLSGHAPQISGDRDTLRRAISNLLSNAIHHTPPHHEVRLLLAEETCNGQTFASVSIENPGTPIAATHLPHLFDRFYRADASRQRSTDGTGLGLAITRSIASLHGGTVTVTSDHRSTRFTLRLPVTD